MTLTIHLSDAQAAALQAKAAAEGLSVEQWIQKLAGSEQPVGRPLQHIADIILDNVKDVPPDYGDDAQGRREPARPLHLRLAKETRMTPLFADTFYWIALADSGDNAHWRAVELTSKLVHAPIVTTDEVLAEYLTFFATALEKLAQNGRAIKRAAPRHEEFLFCLATRIGALCAPQQMRRKAVANARRILNNPGVRVIPQSHDSFLSGMALYEGRPDKRYSLIDCISMQTNAPGRSNRRSDQRSAL